MAIWMVYNYTFHLRPLDVSNVLPLFLHVPIRFVLLLRNHGQFWVLYSVRILVALMFFDSPPEGQLLFG